MSISSIVSRIVPAAIGFATGGPVGSFTAAAATEKAKRQERIIKREQDRQKQEYDKMMDFGMGTTTSRPTFVDPYAAQLKPNVGGGETGFLSTLRGGLREVGGFVGDVFSSGLPQLFGVNRPMNVGQQPAVTTVTNVGAQESQGSGTITAGMGGLLPSLVSGGRALLKSPLGQLALGGGAGFALQGMGSGSSGMRITRK